MSTYMAFDPDISIDVSLSKILDVFILDDEEPSTVVSFLYDHDNEFKDILECSLHGSRIFQLDFFLRCDLNEQTYLLNRIKDTSIDDASFLAWQIMKSNSGKAQTIKYRLRNELHYILEHASRHPYAKNHESYVKPLDDMCLKHSETNTISHIPFYVDDNKLIRCFKYIDYSLFKHRLMQYDFFMNLNAAEKYCFLQSLNKPKPNSYIDRKTFKLLKNLIIQILDSDEDNKVKRLCLNLAFNCLYQSDILEHDMLETIQQCSSFAEFTLKMTILNKEITPYVVLYFLLFKTAWLKDWIEYDRENLDSCLNVSDYVEKYLLTSTIYHVVA